MGWWYIDPHSIVFCGTNALSYMFWFRPWRRVMEVHIWLNQDFWWFWPTEKKMWRWIDPSCRKIFLLNKYMKNRSTTNYTYQIWIMLVKSDEWRSCNSCWKWQFVRLGCERPHVHRSTDLSPANPDVKNMGVILKERILNVWSRQFVARTNAHHL